MQETEIFPLVSFSNLFKLLIALDEDRVETRITDGLLTNISQKMMEDPSDVFGSSIQRFIAFLRVRSP